MLGKWRIFCGWQVSIGGNRLLKTQMWKEADMSLLQLRANRSCFTYGFLSLLRPCACSFLTKEMLLQLYLVIVVRHGSINIYWQRSSSVSDFLRKHHFCAQLSGSCFPSLKMDFLVLFLFSHKDYKLGNSWEFFDWSDWGNMRVSCSWSVGTLDEIICSYHIGRLGPWIWRDTWKIPGKKDRQANVDTCIKNQNPVCN